MGYNTHKWDREAHYAAKTTKQLEDELQSFRDGLEKNKNATLGREGIVNFYVNHIEYLRMKIAERIGK